MGLCTELLHEGEAMGSTTRAESMWPRPSADTAPSLYSPMLLLTASHCRLAKHVSYDAMFVPVQVDKVRC